MTEKAAEWKPGMCQDAPPSAVEAVTMDLASPFASCAEVAGAGMCSRALVQKYCPQSCDACADDRGRRLEDTGRGRRLAANKDQADSFTGDCKPAP